MYTVITYDDEKSLQDALNALTTQTVIAILAKGAKYTLIYTTP